MYLGVECVCGRDRGDKQLERGITVQWYSGVSWSLRLSC
jgi:hypothetical protein